MPATVRSKPKSSSKPRASTKAKTRTNTKKATTARNPTRTSVKKGGVHAEKNFGELTFVYQCTQPDCNYRIVREEKAEQGEKRYDMKCPKCHHQEFRCMGPGDLIEEPHHVPMVEVDFGAFKTIGLGAN